MVICLERGADVHTAQLMPLPLTVSCFSKVQIGFTFLVPAHPEKRAVKRVCVCVPLVVEVSLNKTRLSRTEIDVQETCRELFFGRQEPTQQFAATQHRL